MPEGDEKTLSARDSLEATLDRLRVSDSDIAHDDPAVSFSDAHFQLASAIKNSDAPTLEKLLLVSRKADLSWFMTSCDDDDDDSDDDDSDADSLSLLLRVIQTLTSPLIDVTSRVEAEEEFVNDDDDDDRCLLVSELEWPVNAGVVLALLVTLVERLNEIFRETSKENDTLNSIDSKSAENAEKAEKAETILRPDDGLSNDKVKGHYRLCLRDLVYVISVYSSAPCGLDTRVGGLVDVVLRLTHCENMEEALLIDQEDAFRGKNDICQREQQQRQIQIQKLQRPLWTRLFEYYLSNSLTSKNFRRNHPQRICYRWITNTLSPCHAFPLSDRFFHVFVTYLGEMDTRYRLLGMESLGFWLRIPSIDVNEDRRKLILDSILKCIRATHFELVRVANANALAFLGVCNRVYELRPRLRTE